MSVYQGTNLIAGGRQCMPLLSFMWADHQLNDISWLRADTFSWQSGTVYTAVYQHLLDDYNNAKYNSIVFSAHGDTFECFRTPSLDTTHLGVDYYAWVNSIYGTLYTTSNQPEIGDTIYDDTFAAMSPTVGVVHENNQTETISGTTITYYTAPDGHKIVLENQESNVAAIYAATGVAWYYILDTANQRFKLPRTKFGFTGLRDTVGRYVQEGLPNLNGGSSGWVLTNTDGAVGVFSGNNFAKTLSGYVTNPNWNISSNGGEWYRDINFDASLSNSIYGRSNTVQPKATQMYLYFYVGQFTQTALENTAGLNASLFNDKADISLANLSAAGKTVCANMAMPSSSKTSLTIGASGTQYTAPANGYFIIRLNINSGGYVQVDFLGTNVAWSFGSSNYQQSCIVPVAKGQKITIGYSNRSIATYEHITFVYANSEI